MIRGIKVIEKTNKFDRYLNEAKKNWIENGFAHGKGKLSSLMTEEFIIDYYLKYNRFGMIDPFFIGVYDISMNRDKTISIGV